MIYYPYGMLMDGRHGSAADAYRYGFQGQEMDDEVKGKGNSVNYKYRMHDPRIGRFFAVDPLAPKYPELTPYQFSSNSPIYMVEIEGLEGEPTNNVTYYNMEEQDDGSFAPDTENSWSSSTLRVKSDNAYIRNTETKHLISIEAGQYGSQSSATGVYTYWGYENGKSVITKQVIRTKNNALYEHEKAQHNGKLVFVNGFLGMGSPEGGPEYWNPSFEYGAQVYFGADGYANSHYTDVDHSTGSSAFERRVAGYTYARNHFDELTSGMDKSTDQFYFISHSMGGAFAYGMELYALEQGWTVKTSVFLNTYQARGINVGHKYAGNILHIDYQNTNDPVIHMADINTVVTGQIDIQVRCHANTDFEYIHRYPIDSGANFWYYLEYGGDGNKYKYFESLNLLMK